MARRIPSMFEGPEYDDWTDEQKYETMRSCALIGKASMSNMMTEVGEMLKKNAQKAVFEGRMTQDEYKRIYKDKE